MNTISIQGKFILIDEIPFFIQGMNLFLDPTILEKMPRKIYCPNLISDSYIEKIIPHLIDLKLNSVRLWPRSIKNNHQLQISENAIRLLGEKGIFVILNLPVNWNLKPSLNILKEFVKRYSSAKFPNILLYCINNEAYHGMFSPKLYTQKVHQLTKKYGGRPTLLTNANLNFPWIFCADVIGADFFTYKYSISRNGNQDVGAVARMFFEDAQKTYKFFPKIVIRYYYLVEKYLAWKARKENFDPSYFHQMLMKLLKKTKKHKKPYIIAEYGYSTYPDHLDIIFAQMPILEMQGHIWYNWINFDQHLIGKISNYPLYNKFKEICEKLEKIKKHQGYTANLFH